MAGVPSSGAPARRPDVSSDLYDRLSTAFAAVGLGADEDGHSDRSTTSRVDDGHTTARGDAVPAAAPARSLRIAWGDVGLDGLVIPGGSARASAVRDVPLPPTPLAMGGSAARAHGGVAEHRRPWDDHVMSGANGHRAHAVSSVASPASRSGVGSQSMVSPLSRGTRGGGRGRVADVSTVTAHALAFLGPLSPTGRSTNDMCARAVHAEAGGGGGGGGARGLWRLTLVCRAAGTAGPAPRRPPTATFSAQLHFATCVLRAPQRAGCQHRSRSRGHVARDVGRRRRRRLRLRLRRRGDAIPRADVPRMLRQAECARRGRCVSARLA